MVIDWHMLIVEVLGFLITYFFLAKFVFPGILKTLADRQGKIAADLAHAEKMKKDMEDLKAQYELSLGKIEDERRELIRETVKRAEELRAELIAKAEADIAKMKGRATRDIEVELDKALKAMREQIVEATLLAASRLIQTEMNDARQKSLVDSFLQKIDRAEM